MTCPGRESKENSPSDDSLPPDMSPSPFPAPPYFALSSPLPATPFSALSMLLSLATMQNWNFHFILIFFPCTRLPHSLPWIFKLGEFKLLYIFLTNINRAESRNSLRFHFYKTRARPATRGSQFSSLKASWAPLRTSWWRARWARSLPSGACSLTGALWTVPTFALVLWSEVLLSFPFSFPWVCIFYLPSKCLAFSTLFPSKQTDGWKKGNKLNLFPSSCVAERDPNITDITSTFLSLFFFNVATLEF